MDLRQHLLGSSAPSNPLRRPPSHCVLGLRTGAIPVLHGGMGRLTHWRGAHGIADDECSYNGHHKYGPREALASDAHSLSFAPEPNVCNGSEADISGCGIALCNSCVSPATQPIVQVARLLPANPPRQLSVGRRCEHGVCLARSLTCSRTHWVNSSGQTSRDQVQNILLRGER